MTLSSRDQFKVLNKAFGEISEFSSHVEGFKNSKVKAYFGESAPEGLKGKPVDQSTVASFIKQAQSLLENKEKSYETLDRKVASSKTKRVKIESEEETISQFSYPFYVSDLFLELVKTGNFGVANLSSYEDRGVGDAVKVNGNDENDVRNLLTTVYPGVTPTDDIIKSHSIHPHLKLLLESNIVNGVAINDLFNIFAKANGLVDSKNASRIKINDVLLQKLFKQKVDWTIGGSRLLDGVDIDKHRSEMTRVLRDGEHWEALASSRRKDCETWQKTDRSPPKSKKAKSYLLWESNKYEDLYASFCEAQRKSDALSKDAKELIALMFNGEVSSSPFPLLRKILNQGKTFEEVLKERSPTAIVSETDAKDGVWGYSSTMTSTIISYLRVPSVITKSRMEPKFTDFLKNEAVVKSALSTKDTVRSLFETQKRMTRK